jgi:hypothetical protein
MSVEPDHRAHAAINAGGVPIRKFLYLSMSLRPAGEMQPAIRP